MTDPSNEQKDASVGTTGHEWDGIKELNNPLPLWWLWIFYATIIVAIIYFVIMPTFPLVSSYTAGTLNQSDRVNVEAAVNAARLERVERGAGLGDSSMEQIRSDTSLLEYGLAAGEAAFGDNCATCHGRGSQRIAGYPYLHDDVWLWGGTLDEIRQTIRFGIRADHDQTRFSQMPAFLSDGILTDDQVGDLADFVMSLSGSGGEFDAINRASSLFALHCASCHGEQGLGDQAQGAPNLSDRDWLYGGDRTTIIETISFSRYGVMPAWETRLDPITVRALAVYVHSLGGGEEETVSATE